MPVKLSDDLVTDAREEAKVADRSLTSQIEHWARLGRQVESILRHEDVVNLKRAGQGEFELPPFTRRNVLTILRRIASERQRRELATTIRAGRTVYQDAGEGRIEKITPAGEKTRGRFVDRRFVADGTPQRR